MRTGLLLLVLLPAATPAHAGLDITAYESLTIVKSPKLTADGEPQGANQVLLSAVDFPERIQGLESGKVYRFKTSFEFRAGSYSGYNAWRNELAKLAGYEQSLHKNFDGKLEQRYDATVWKRKDCLLYTSPSPRD